MAGETTTTYIGLQIPGFNQANWQVPIDYDLNLLDLIFGGQITVPALSVTDLTIENLGSIFAGIFVPEVPVGLIPGNVYTLTYPPIVMINFNVNGLFQRPGIDYTIADNVLTLTNSTSDGDTVYATYLR